jgi:protein SCO1/2
MQSILSLAGRVALVSALLIFTSLNASEPIIPTNPEIGIDGHLGDTVPGKVILYDENNQPVELGKLIDKPTIISFVYYRCPGICSPLMDGIAEVIDKSDLKPGVDYQVLTISFNPAEGYDLAVKKKMNYLNMVKTAGAKEGWRFFTADSANIAVVTDALGFHYKRMGNDFLHAAGLIVVSPEGKITRYLQGTYFLPFEFKMALIESADGKVGPTINKVLQYCYSYDPRGQQYVMNVTKISAFLILTILLLFFGYLGIRPLFRKHVTSKTS